jgi:HptB-dependent secretion and biofilm anti anti-sigma factor
MSVTTTVSPDGHEIIIRVKGNFDFTAYESFRQAAHYAHSPGTRYIVDLQEADYLHDSGLGMLLKLRSFANVDDVSINVINCRPELKARLLDLKLHRYVNIH